ncbi:MAG TPA: hypothetical protein VFQ53_08700 [Kofleriaceae bacterium]|nr:hypothetical protein [Kofleriaceae bacterium]
MRTAVLCVLAIGCKFEPSPAGDGGAIGDVPRDLPDTPGGCQSYSTQFDTCTVVPPGGPGAALLLNGNNTYDTDSGNLVTPAGSVAVTHLQVTSPAGKIDVVFVDGFTLGTGATLRVDGGLPFGIASTGELRVDGLIDLSDDGAGARSDTACAGSVGADASNRSGGAGGGGGGGFQGTGGTGGPGDKDGGPVAGAAGGVAIALPAGLVGGCDGGGGGDGQGGASGGSAGDGGGAVLLASATAVRISGAINVGGGGGVRGGGNGASGGGGGSGGMILVESPLVEVSGVLAANGGGGGEGQTTGQSGSVGLASDQPAPGGAGGDPDGGDAGNGGAGASLAGGSPADLQDGGGGGGGGGVGYVGIHCPAPTISGIVSPAVTTIP